MQVQSDLAYGPHPRQCLDFYPAARGAPLVIYIHGGAFMMGDKANTEWDDMTSIAALRHGGFAVASLNYRFSAHAIWPAQLDDLRAAVAYLRAGDFGFDAGRIGCFGPSAGGHLSLCLTMALAGDPATVLQACAAWFPVVDFLEMDSDIEASGIARESARNDAPTSPESLLVGAPIRQVPDKARAASPLALLAALPQSASLPPFFLQHGARDALVAAKQSLRMQAALRARGASCALEILPDGTHGGGTFDDPATMGRIVAFFQSTLGA